MGRMDSFRSPGDFYTGKMNERDVFGSFRPSPKFREAYRAIARENGYVGYEASLDLVRKHGTQDPLNPEKPFANELRLAVIEALGLETEEEMDRVKFFTAVETPADQFHGIDGWIEYETQDGRRIVVTVDVTKNPNKDEWKADVIIPEITDPSEDEDAFLAQAETYGGKVVDYIQDRDRLAA